MKQKSKKATTLVEIVVALAIAVGFIIPISLMFSQTSWQVTKSQNFSFAASLSRRLTRYIQQMPFKKIVDVPLPGLEIGGTKNDMYFGAIINEGNSAATIKYLIQNDMPGLCAFLKKFHFQYSLSVSTVTFAPADSVKSIAIYIFWKEGGKDYIYQSHVFATSS